jgi:hypothetical protein
VTTASAVLARVTQSGIDYHPPNDPWPVLFWIVGLLLVVAIIWSAATIANQAEDRRAQRGARRRSGPGDGSAGQ